MKRIYISVLLMLVTAIACDTKKEEVLPEGTSKITAKEFINASRFTYILGDVGGKDQWIAVNQMPVEKGDIFYFADAMEMKNFESKTLDRTFESVLFVNTISRKIIDKSKSDAKIVKPKRTVREDAVKEKINITPLANGQTIQSIIENKDKLKDKTIRVKGVVTKFNSGIMGKNWLHIQDGTSSGSAIDITVTSDQEAKIDDTIILEGTVSLDKDFGSGYFYDVIIENAIITVE
ncbi:MAG: hypothetical protein V3V16_00675 [Melioribacteraceae bacterium]